MAKDKYIEYMKNVGGRVSIAGFFDDWAPIGSVLLENMVNKKEVKLEGLEVVLITKGDDDE